MATQGNRILFRPTGEVLERLWLVSYYRYSQPAVNQNPAAANSGSVRIFIDTFTVPLSVRLPLRS